MSLKVFRFGLKIFKQINTKYPQVVGVGSVPCWWWPLVAGYTRKISMYLPRGKLLALIAVVVAASMVSATGAFSSTEVQRSAEIKVVGDKKAYLAIQPSDKPNGDYAKTTDGGKFKLAITSTKEGGQGLNKDSLTAMHNVIAITNQGTQTVSVTVDEKSNNNAVTFYKGADPSNKIESSGVEVGVGDTLLVGVEIDLRGDVGEGDLINKVVINANSDGSSSSGDSSSSDSSSSGSSSSSSNPAGDAMRPA
jgi:hypothetical protein